MRTKSDILIRLSLATGNDYVHFSKYCSLIDQGLRKEALKHLDTFIGQTQTWDFKSKSTFCNLLFTEAASDNDLDFILKKRLNDELIKPTLSDMMQADPKNFLPFKWYGHYYRDTASLKKAHELNPQDFDTKYLLLVRLENDLWLSTHHLPEGYLGDDSDETDLELAFKILSTVDNTIGKNFFDRFTEYKNQIADYHKAKK